MSQRVAPLRRLGVNLLFLVPGGVGGTEVYATELLASLSRLRPDLDLVIYCAPEALSFLARRSWSSHAKLIVSPFPSRFKPLRILAELSWLPLRAKHDDVDLLHSMGTTGPVLCPVASVITVHDTIYHQVPDSFPWPSRWGLELLVPRAAKRADCLIADSESARRDVATTLGLPPDRFLVSHIGLGAIDRGQPTGPAVLRERYGLGNDRVMLTVSAALPHKNLDRLLEAFSRVAFTESTRLVIVGHRGRAMESLAAHAAALGVRDRVCFTGWIPRADLEGLYQLAMLFVYPSLIEGFGMPVLEAMARGVPVACSSAPALVEVGGSAAEYFDPLDEGDIARTLASLVEDTQKAAEMIVRGTARASEFTWDRCAETTMTAYEQAVAAFRRREKKGDQWRRSP